jgi:hypothetical protein
MNMLRKNRPSPPKTSQKKNSRPQTPTKTKDAEIPKKSQGNYKKRRGRSPS